MFDQSYIIGNFVVYINKALQSYPDFYEVMVIERKFANIGIDSLFYVNIHKDSRFPIEYKYPPKPFKIKIKNDGTEVVMTETDDEKIYRIEHSAYSVRKESAGSQQLWLLHFKNVEKLLDTVRNIK